MISCRECRCPKSWGPPTLQTPNETGDDSNLGLLAKPVLRARLMDDPPLRFLRKAPVDFPQVHGRFSALALAFWQASGTQSEHTWGNPNQYRDHLAKTDVCREYRGEKYIGCVRHCKKRKGWWPSAPREVSGVVPACWLAKVRGIDHMEGTWSGTSSSPWSPWLIPENPGEVPAWLLLDPGPRRAGRNCAAGADRRQHRASHRIRFWLRLCFDDNLYQKRTWRAPPTLSATERNWGDSGLGLLAKPVLRARLMDDSP